MHPVSILNEATQQLALPPPVYYVDEPEGPAHSRVFPSAEVVIVHEDGWDLMERVHGNFYSTHEAKAAAAKAMCIRLIHTAMSSTAKK